ncbi:hypothetical protein [Nitrosomonas communis]|uniref:Uncharacterized protein n=1 Tax=Nitrosomonas communis TaxID=44574 RepID=A0A1H2T2H1_9PROT|nr:hypothetical protein [Nitrosomonas communis]SDW38032.1 hypothetical protein SAMN05421882_100957 [Nitrosomonas communis]
METIEEQLLLLKDRLIAYKSELSICRINASALAYMISNLESENQNIKHENLVLKEKIESFYHANLYSHQCKHCGSVKLKKIICIADTFFTCLDCKKESIITIDTVI